VLGFLFGRKRERQKKMLFLVDAALCTDDFPCMSGYVPSKLFSLYVMTMATGLRLHKEGEDKEGAKVKTVDPCNGRGSQGSVCYIT